MRLDDVLSAVRPVTDDNPGSVVVIGGGKSAQDIAAYLAHEGRQRNVSMIFEKTDAFVASSAHIPDWIRKSRYVVGSVMICLIMAYMMQVDRNTQPSY